LVLLACVLPASTFFCPHSSVGRRATATQLSSSSSSTENQVSTTTPQPKSQKYLGLLTFDLDDSLYPLERVINEANEAFVRAMNNYGFTDITPWTIDKTGRRIRQEMAKTDPEGAAVLTHTEVRLLAIREEMERIILERKLRATAEDWATDVNSLTDIVVKSAQQWAKNAVSPSVVQAVHTAWEMERYHAAERNLYPEVIDVLKQIKDDHPNVIIGAVTDGKANPMLMTFTLAPYFDFCMSWEDDQGARRKFFKELASASSNAELTWIYDAAKEKYRKLAEAVADIDAARKNEEPLKYEDAVWIHVGDDLAYDVGGSSSCGAKTIYLELDEKYGQTARTRFDGREQPSWSTSSEEEIEKRRIMNEQALEYVDAKISFLTRLPEAINDILEQENEQ
jgi:putative hydrolase of the HAD superfamily